MKKNISINISGIIFHIEEDGYEKLKNYLNSIAEYFSSFDDSKEITSDIEGRIAEIFLSKLSDDKQVITQEDVESLIATMGSIKDFQAAEEVFTEESTKKEQSEESHEKATGDIPYSSKKLYRDESRKIIGGVCSGIGAYFRIDPLWVRLLTLTLFLVSYGTLILVYIIMWIVIPGSKSVADDQKLKKMFRNPDDKVIAGISSGMAAYFGVDVTMIRLLFVALTLMGGTGILIYLIFWFILPEARSITEKVQMQGEPVTLSNIEHNVKKSLNVREGEEESTLVKILLFPFRLIAAILNGIGKALGPLLLFIVDFIRVLTGIAISSTGIIGIFATIISAGIIYGIFNGGIFYNWDLLDLRLGHPVGLFIDTIPSITIFCAVILIIVPFIFFILLGISIIAKRIVFNSTVGWSLFGLLIISTIVLAINVPAIVYGFHEHARYEDSQLFDINEQTTSIRVDESKGIADYDIVDLWITGYEGDKIKVNLDYSSQGANNAEAIENAKMVNYYMEKPDSVLIFGSTLEFPPGSKFRFQELDINLNIPYNHPFRLDRSMREIMSYRFMERYGYKWSQINDDNIWIITEYGIECLNCEKAHDGWGAPGSGKGISRIYDLEDFNSIGINSPITVRISKSDTYKVEVMAEERFIDDIELRVEDGELVANVTGTSLGNLKRSRDAIVLKISTPEIQSISLSQASKAYIDEMQAENLMIDMNGASNAEFRITAVNVHIKLNGNSKLRLTGKSENLTVEANGLSQLEAYRFTAKNGTIAGNGASSLELYLTDEIRLNRDAVSSVRYRGGAKEIN